jgi:hypothetical protein
VVVCSSINLSKRALRNLCVYCEVGTAILCVIHLNFMFPSFSVADCCCIMTVLSATVIEGEGFHLGLHSGEGTLLVAQLVEALRYKPECRGVDSLWCHWNYFTDMILPAAQWPGVDSASNRHRG